MRSIRFAYYAGVPVAQGSKTQMPVGPKCRYCRRPPTRMVESADKKLRPYRAAITAAARVAGGPDWTPLNGGVGLDIEITYHRPDGHTKKNGELRKGKPLHKVSKPDLSKLLRAIEDSLTDAKIWSDDSHVVAISITKLYAGELDHPGVRVRVLELDE